MKNIFVVFCSLLLSSTVLAGTINLDAGESITVTPQRETTVTCAAGSSSKEPTITFSYCDCYQGSINGSSVTQANLHIQYSHLSSPVERTIKQFSGTSSAAKTECEEFIRTVAACRH